MLKGGMEVEILVFHGCEYGSSEVLGNVGILQQHRTASQPRTRRLERKVKKTLSMGTVQQMWS
jgi:hypothetical protein